MSIIDELRKSNVIIVGAGMTGKSLANFLVKEKIEFQIFDEKISDMDGLPVLNELPQDIDLALVSPGWKKDQSDIVNLRNRGVRLLSELDLAWSLKEILAPNQIWLGVTGTNGKTTTVQMLESILNQSQFRAIACGNVGLPVVEAVTSPENFEVLAIELSSFQIEWSNLPKYQAISILNIADDHIDWHETFDNYANSKLKLLDAAEISILNSNDPEIALRSTAHGGKKVFFSLSTPNPWEIGVVEELLVDRAFVANPQNAESFGQLLDVHPSAPHNISNAMAAAGLALAIGVPHPVVNSGLKNFKLDHHRLELVLSKDGIDWINDSKATNPHAAKAALSSYQSNIWIAGGLAKGARMADLISKTGSRIKAAILIGQDRENIAAELLRLAPHVNIYRIDAEGDAQEMMDRVVTQAKDLAEVGDTVILAPACASMDQFKSYAQRGEFFSNSVRKILKA